MIARLFALVVLAALAAAGLYLWKAQGGELRPAESLGEIGSQIHDTATTAAVKAALELNRDLKPYAIAVSTERGVVTLRGSLPEKRLVDSAGRVAAAVPDVKQVVNHLQASSDLAAHRSDGRTLGESLDDQGLEVQARLAFSLNRDLKGLPIELRAFKRELQLSGTVPSEAIRQLAVETAEAVPGVAGVSDELGIAGSAPPSGAGPLRAVERALRANPNLASQAIEVRREGARIVLRGSVRSGAERDLAGLLARDAAGEPVVNALEIRR